jgi:hypothetical protein
MASLTGEKLAAFGLTTRIPAAERTVALIGIGAEDVITC